MKPQFLFRFSVFSFSVFVFHGAAWATEPLDALAPRLKLLETHSYAAGSLAFEKSAGYTTRASTSDIGKYLATGLAVDADTFVHLGSHLGVFAEFFYKQSKESTDFNTADSQTSAFSKREVAMRLNLKFRLGSAFEIFGGGSGYLAAAGVQNDTAGPYTLQTTYVNALVWTPELGFNYHGGALNLGAFLGTGNTAKRTNKLTTVGFDDTDTETLVLPRDFGVMAELNFSKNFSIAGSINILSCTVKDTCANYQIYNLQLNAPTFIPGLGLEIDGSYHKASYRDVELRNFDNIAYWAGEAAGRFGTDHFAILAGALARYGKDIGEDTKADLALVSSAVGVRAGVEAHF